MDILSAIADALAGIEATVLAWGPSPWLLLAVVLLACLDGFFPPVPSESVVIAVATLAVTGDVPAPYLVLLALAAALGAFAGDLIAYRIGATIPVDRLRLFRGRRGQAALARTRGALTRRGSAVILSGRFVPVGRVAVNMTAGAVGYPLLRFAPVAGLASLLWAVLSTLIGIGAGHVLAERPLLAVGIGIATGMLLGLGVDKALSRLRRQPPVPEVPARPPGADGPAASPGPHPPAPINL